MYRLSGFMDRRIQEIISRELYNSFLYAFDISPKTLLADEDRLRDFFDFSYDAQNLSRMEVLTIKKRLKKMCQELLDPEYEYTFDLFGENLLFKILYCIRDDEETYKDMLEDKKYFWESSASEEDLKYVKEYMKGFLLNEFEDLDEEEKNSFENKPEVFADAYSEILTRRICFASCMVNEVDNQDGLYFDELDILFWDLDSTFLDNIKPSDFNKFIKQYASILGFIEISPSREKHSGSLKSPLFLGRHAC